MTVSGEPGAVGWRFFLWWMLAFLNFPIDGYLALVLVGSVDGALSGALGGALWHYRYVGAENVERLGESGMNLQGFLERRGVVPSC